MQIPFRLYGKQGCLFCLRAEAFFVYKGVPCQVIEANDPITAAGIKAITGKDTVPILVAPGEIIVGFKEAEYARVADAWIARNGGSPVDPNNGSGDNPSATSTDTTLGPAPNVPVVQ